MIHRESTISTMRQNTGENGVAVKGNRHRVSCSPGSSLVPPLSASSARLAFLPQITQSTLKLRNNITTFDELIVGSFLPLFPWQSILLRDKEQES